MKNKKIISIIVIILFIFAILIVCLRMRNEKIEKVFYEPEYNKELITGINQIEIKNDAIKNKYQFVFISDLHASIIDENEPDEQIRQALIERNNMFYGEEKDKSQKVFSEIINYTNNKNADALLLGGDIIDSPSNSNLKFLKDNIKNVKCKTLYTFGNHDWTHAWNYQTQETAEKYKPLFKELQNDLVVDYIEYEDLVILAIDDSKNKIDKEAIEKVQAVFDKKKPTIVMMHVPIATKYISEETVRIRNRLSAIGEDGIKPDENTKKVLDMILDPNNNVIKILAGHIHFDIEDKVNNIFEEKATAPAYSGNINVIKINK